MLKVVFALVVVAIAGVIAIPTSGSACTPGEYRSNGACFPCAAGTFSTTQNAASCKAHTNCQEGQYVKKEPTPFSNRLCFFCANGKFSETVNAPSCTPFSVCPAGFKQLKRPTHSSDRVCAITTVKSMLPFGILVGDSVGDSVLPSGDDSPNVELPFTFTYFGTTYNSVFVNNNGVLSFGGSFSAFVTSGFPIAHPLIAPFWNDIDTRHADAGVSIPSSIPGVPADYVYCRVDSDSSSSSNRAIQSIIRTRTTATTYTPARSVIATWYKVGRYNSQFGSLNSFQAVLTTDGSRSFSVFLYPQGGVEWIQTGTGGYTQVGFNKGDGENYFNLPGSRTPDIANLAQTSNVDYRGMWIFRVDQS